MDYQLTIYCLSMKGLWLFHRLGCGEGWLGWVVPEVPCLVHVSFHPLLIPSCQKFSLCLKRIIGTPSWDRKDCQQSATERLLKANRVVGHLHGFEQHITGTKQVEGPPVTLHALFPRSWHIDNWESVKTSASMVSSLLLFGFSFSNKQNIYWMCIPE